MQQSQYPAGGEEVAGTLEADGFTTGGAVHWSMSKDGTVERTGTARNEPYPSGRTLWRAGPFKLSSLDPGHYTFTASVTVNRITYTDTRQITVE